MLERGRQWTWNNRRLQVLSTSWCSHHLLTLTSKNRFIAIIQKLLLTCVYYMYICVIVHVYMCIFMYVLVFKLACVTKCMYQILESTTSWNKEIFIWRHCHVKEVLVDTLQVATIWKYSYIYICRRQSESIRGVDRKDGSLKERITKKAVQVCCRGKKYRTNRKHVLTASTLQKHLHGRWSVTFSVWKCQWIQ